MKNGLGIGLQENRTLLLRRLGSVLPGEKTTLYAAFISLVLVAAFHLPISEQESRTRSKVLGRSLSLTGHHRLQALRILQGGELDLDGFGKLDVLVNSENGHSYSYWGMGSTYSVLPFVALFGEAVTDRGITQAVAILVTLLWLAVFAQLARLWKVSLAEWERAFLALSVCLGTQYFFLAYIPWGSYTTHGFAMLYLSGALLAFVVGLNGVSRRWIWLITGVLVAWACSCRVSLFQIVPLIALLGALFARRVVQAPFRSTILALIVPAALVFCHEQIWLLVKFPGGFFSSTIAEGKPYSLDYFVGNLNAYLLAPVKYRLVKGSLSVVFPGTGSPLWSYEFGVWLIVAAFHFKTWVVDGREETLFRSMVTSNQGLMYFGCALLWLAGFLPLLFFRYTGETSFGCRYLMDVQPFLMVLVFGAYVQLRRYWYTKVLGLGLLSAAMVVELATFKWP